MVTATGRTITAVGHTMVAAIIAIVTTSRPLQLICKDKGSVIRFRRDASDGDDHGCEGDFGKEICCAAERRGTRATRSADTKRQERSPTLAEGADIVEAVSY